MTRKITMSKLGQYGQWGNQVFQYAFLKAYARRHGLIYETPRWVGQYLYGRNDPAVSAALPPFHERIGHTTHESCFAVPYPPKGEECVNRDFVGWAQWHTAWHAPDREYIQSLFDAPCKPVAERVRPAMDVLRSMGDTVVALHLRRGDAGRMIFFHTPIVWCLKWLQTNWERLQKPVLYLAVEDVSLVPYFRYYAPQIMETLGISPVARVMPLYQYPHEVTPDKARQLDFFPDWYVMQHADIVVAAESTYSVSAAMMNKNLREFWRPRLSLRGFEQCDPWNMEVSPREHLDDYPGVPGTQIDANPAYARYWGNYKPRHQAVPELEADIQAVMRPGPRPVSVALCVIATGKYHDYAQRMIDSARQYFLPDCDVTILLFTDGPPIPGTVHCKAEHRPWPGPTLYRYHTMLAEVERLAQSDYVFYCDADMQFVQPVGREILGNLTAVCHQYFCNQPRYKWTYETRPESRAYIPGNEGQHYYAGGFQGGRSQVFIEAMQTMRDAIDDDAQRGLTAVWHDESHWNHYLLYSREPDVKLSPAYCTDEGNPVPDAKLLAKRKPEGMKCN